MIHLRQPLRQHCHLQNVHLRIQKSKLFSLKHILISNSFEEIEANNLVKQLQSLKAEDLNITPPVAKKRRITGVEANFNISFYEFLTTPLIQTRQKQVEVMIYSLIMKN